MIRINNFFSDEIIEKYANYTIRIIHDRYEKNKPTSPEVKKIFEDDGGNFDEEKLRNILIKEDEVIAAKRYGAAEKKEIKQIMNYKDIIHSIDKLTDEERETFGEFGIRHALLVDLDVRVCPYCNRQYITYYYEDKNKRTTADLDHFHPQSKYPLLSLSLYNFVPSCSLCNSSTMKGQLDKKIVYPYKEHFGENCFFKLVPKESGTRIDYQRELDALLGKENVEYKLVLEVKNSSMDDKIRNSIKIFKLDQVYQSHAKYAQELRSRKRIYGGEDYLQLENKLKLGMRFTDKDIEFFMYGYDWADGEDINRPLSKLSYDIVKR